MQHKSQISDDYVLQVMTQLQLDASNSVEFRTIRHWLNHAVPLCCIAFNLKIILPIQSWLPDLDKADRLIERGKPLGESLGFIAFAELDYQMWAIGDRKLNYTPCPACVINNNFVDIPAGCPCCSDQQAYPSPV